MTTLPSNPPTPTPTPVIGLLNQVLGLVLKCNIPLLKHRSLTSYNVR